MKFFDASRYASPLRKALAKKENAPRNLRFETLENRALLSVTPLDELQAAVASAEIAPAQTAETPVVDLSVLAVSNATTESGVLTETEPNDAFDAAQNLGTLTETTTLTGEADASRKNDYFTFKIEFPQDTVGLLRVDGSIRLQYEHSSTANLQLTLQNANGVSAATTTGTNGDRVVSFTGLSAGDYYVLVKNSTPNTAAVPYTLTFEPTTFEVDDDDYEENDSLETAKNLGMVGSLELDLKAAPGSDDDYFKFTTTGSGTDEHYVAVEYEHVAGSQDALLQLYDGNGTALANRISNAATGTETVSLAGLPAGDYYIRVHNHITSATVAVPYKLTIEAPKVAPVAPTTFATNGDEATFNYTTLSWNNVDFETGYELRYTTDVDKTDAEANWTTVVVDADVTEFTAKNLAYGTEYKFQLRAVNDFGQSAWLEVKFPTVAAPEPPQELGAAPLVPETLTTALTWKDLANELGYVVDLLDADGVSLLESPVELDAGTTSWTTPALALGTTYQFQVTAINNAGDATAELTFMTENVPNAPTGLKATVADAAETSATLKWDAATETGAEAVVAYVVTYTDGQTVLTQTVDVATAENPTTCQLLNLVKGATYDVTVVAVNAYGDSAAATVKFSTLETPSTVVTTLSDVVDKYDGEISLREAIAYAEADATLGTTITFDAEAYADELDADGKATIVLGGSQLVVSQALTIDGGENGVTVDANKKYRVLQVKSTSAPAAFKNLTITGGYGTGNGAGVYLTTGAQATFENVAISGNQTSGDYGAGVYLAPQAVASFSNVTISQNSGTSNGGGIHVQPDAKATFTDVLFTENSATYGGGAHISGTATFTNVEIFENTAQTNGGGVHVVGKATFTNVKISGNTSEHNGGGIRVNGSATFTNVEFTGNTSANNGAALYVKSGGNATLTNATIAGNNATSENGGGIYNDGTTNIYNSILVDNVGGDFSDAGTSNAYNTLSGFTAWDNAKTDAATQYVYDETLPLFTDAENGDYTLAAGSQAINKGADSYVADSITTDLAGNPRFNGTVDLGAYENQLPFAPTDLTATVLNPETLTVDLTWNDVAGNETGYVVETLVDGAWVAATEETLAADAQIWTTGKLELGTTYAYRVAAVNDYGQSAWATVEFTTENVPTQPIGLTATINPSLAPTATLTWDADENATAYEVTLYQIVVDADGETTVVAFAPQTVADATYTTETLDFGGTYYFEVAAVNAYGKSEVATSVTFAVGKLPTAPTELTADLDEVALTATLSWDAASNHTGYRVELQTQNADGETVWETVDNLAADAETWSTDVAVDTTYRYRVVAWNAYGETASETVEVVVKNVPTAPTKLTADLDEVALTATLSWTAASNQTGYRVELQTQNVDGETVWETVDNLAADVKTWSTDVAVDTTYRYRVVAWNAYGETASETVEVVVENIPAQPTGLEYEFNHDANNVILTWTAVEGADAYVVEQLGADGEWTPVAPPVGNPETTATTWESGAFDFGTSHAFRVVAKNAYGSSVASDAVSFTIQDEPTVVTSLEDGDLNLLDDVTTLREALRFAQDGDEIVFAEGLRGGTIKLTAGPLSIMEKEISINGFVDETGAPELTIDGDHKDMVFVVSNTRASFFGLSVVNGYASYAQYEGGALGGGFCVDNANATFTNVDVIGCRADVYGGGIYIGCNVEAPGQGKSTLTNVRILDNASDNGESSGLGGGLYATGGFMGGEIEMTNVEISGNQARVDGGGVFFNDVTSTLTNVKITDNIAQGNGGAFYANAPDHTSASASNGYPLFLISTKLTNVEITGNQAYKGFGFYAEEFDVEELSLRNVTLADNAGTQEGASADVYLANGVATFYNSIVDGEVQGEEYAANAYKTLSSYTAWANAGEEGVVNYEIDATKPLFADAENGDYALAENSQAINKGADAYVPETITTDLAGNNRFNGTVDAGAYEDDGSLPLAPTGLAATVNPSTAPTATLKWDAAETATGYVVTVCDANGEIVETSDEIAILEWTTTAGKLQLGATYSVTVVARNAYGDSEISTSETFTVGTVPTVPTALNFKQYVALNGTGTTQISWTDNSNDENQFVVEYKALGDETWSSLGSTQADATALKFKNYVPGTTYVYRVGALNEYGVAWSAEVEFTPLAAPSDVALASYDAVAQTATLEWTGVSTNATSYRIQVSIDGATWKTVKTVDASVSSTPVDVALGSTYVYRVAAFNANCASVWTESEIFDLLNAPSDIAFKQYTASSGKSAAQISWVDNSNDETGFRVEFKEAGADAWKLLAVLDANVTSTRFSNIEPGTDYVYRVRAEKADGNSAWIEAKFSPLAAPSEATFDEYDAETGKVLLSWTEVENTTLYRVEVKVDDGKWSLVKVVNGATSYTLSNVSPGSSYAFRVRACGDNNGGSTWTESDVFTPLLSPSDVTLDPTTGSVSWNDNTDAETLFRVETSTDGVVWSPLGTVGANETSLTNEALATTEEIFIRVRAENNFSASPWAEVALPSFAAPSDIAFKQFTASSGKSAAQISWVDNSTDATGFRVEFKEVGSDNWQLLTVVGANATSTKFANFEPGTDYLYRVRAEKAGAVSVWTEAAFAPLAAPSEATFGEYDAETGKVLLSWTEVENTTLYRVEVKVDDGKWSLVKVVNGATSYTLSNVSPGSSYAFRVCACGDNNGGSTWTESDVFTPAIDATPEISAAKLTSDAFASAFDEFDFFGDEDDLDALAKRLL